MLRCAASTPEFKHSMSPHALEELCVAILGTTPTVETIQGE